MSIGWCVPRQKCGKGTPDDASRRGMQRGRGGRTWRRAVGRPLAGSACAGHEARAVRCRARRRASVAQPRTRRTGDGSRGAHRGWRAGTSVHRARHFRLSVIRRDWSDEYRPPAGPGGHLMPSPLPFGGRLALTSPRRVLLRPAARRAVDADHLRDARASTSSSLLRRRESTPSRLQRPRRPRCRPGVACGRLGPGRSRERRDLETDRCQAVARGGGGWL